MLRRSSSSAFFVEPGRRLVDVDEWRHDGWEVEASKRCSSIEAANTKRRCLEVNGVVVQNREPSLRNLCYGLNGRVSGRGEPQRPSARQTSPG